MQILQLFFDGHKRVIKNISSNTSIKTFKRASKENYRKGANKTQTVNKAFFFQYFTGKVLSKNDRDCGSTLHYGS